jgi:hypothetical protein
MGALMALGPSTDGPGDLNRFAATELAILFVEYGQGGTGLVSTASPQLVTDADNLIALLTPDEGLFTVTALVDVPTAPNQVLATAVPNEVPLPATVWMFGAGLAGGFGLLRKRRKRGAICA